MSARNRRVANWITLAYLADTAITAWVFFAISLSLLISLGGWAWGRLASAVLGSCSRKR